MELGCTNSLRICSSLLHHSRCSIIDFIWELHPQPRSSCKPRLQTKTRLSPYCRRERRHRGRQIRVTRSCTRSTPLTGLASNIVKAVLPCFSTRKVTLSLIHCGTQADPGEGPQSLAEWLPYTLSMCFLADQFDSSRDSYMLIDPILWKRL